MSHFSRRKFSALAGAGAVIAPRAFAQRPAATVTATDIVDRIRGKVGVEWKPDTVDTFKAGDPAAAVKGIAITTMATMEVLKQAVAAGANMVITAEPTFFAKADNPNPPPGRGQGANATPDPVLAAKKDFIEKNGLIVWRFSDHWRLRKPDPLAQGLTDVMGWSKYQVAGDATHFELPAVTLDALAGDLKKKLGIRGGMRVVGDPKSEIGKVGLLTGTTALAASLRTMPAVDAIVAGEVREWESVEYAQDTVAAGIKKGMILLGRVISEEPGMNLCATWLQGFVSEVPVKWIPTGDPYWRPV
jgi:putative NIF3 family GTP cyclohydrolase 1 type 2